MQNTLNGWCASIRWADKLINSDSIHTAKGHPIYFECTDNYDDLRARFAPLVARLRTINQLTSYRSTPYQQLRDQLSDRQVPNHAYVEKMKIARRRQGPT